MAQDSGALRGRRRIAGGRRDLRQALLQAARAASLHNPTLKTAAQRLRDKGKPHMSCSLQSPGGSWRVRMPSSNQGRNGVLQPERNTVVRPHKRAFLRAIAPLAAMASGQVRVS
ncbi:hypothetical protein EG244_18855 [Falsigemmobacter faecalis]|uniref:Uncharacterized protein n=1 Tax=Falsigemmobacter faecalis TaxID=2488730 RepID=A0A3P3D653_9RHOB|nr:hypothetical protein EG244_18855 [Falsigemmobacter faecalis]